MSSMGVEGLGSVLGAAGFTPLAPAAAQPTTAARPTSGPAFGDLVLDGLDRLDGVQRTADNLAVQAATGDLQNLHDYTIAATEAQVTTQVTVALRNKAVEAFTEIMRMQVG